MKPMHSKMGGHFKLTAYKLDGRKRELAEFDNIILDQGLERIATATGQSISWCHVGSGSATPLATDTQLQTKVAHTSTSGSVSASTGVQNTPPYYGWYRRSYQFPIGEATGTLAEVGIGWSTANDSLFSRALIQDSEGAPTTIVVLADEILEVTYEIRMYPPDYENDYLFTTQFSGVDYDVIMRPADITTQGFWAPAIQAWGLFYNSSFALTGHAGPIGPVTGHPSGNQTSGVSGSVQAYVPGSLQREVSWNLGLSQFNLPSDAPIRSIHLQVNGALGSYQMEFDPPIPKTPMKTMSLSMMFSWGRV